jgi:hypothetical protein
VHPRRHQITDEKGPGDAVTATPEALPNALERT